MKLAHVSSGSSDVVIDSIREDLNEPLGERRIRIHKGELTLFLSVEDFPEFAQKLLDAAMALGWRP